MRQILLLVLSFISITTEAQQTIGVFTNEEAAEEGYTLFCPMRGNSTYLIDDCGKLINQWESDKTPGLTTYLLPNGNLLRTEKNGNPNFVQTSAGGIIKLIDWDNNVLWEYSFLGSDFIQHHDAKMMPNGNIIMLIWERIEQAEYIGMGKNPDEADTRGLWLEAIFEIEPLMGTDTFNLVWEWRMRDHLIQDFDERRLNFGVVKDHPELIDINYRKLTDTGRRDFWHCNALDYNEALDEIVINSRNNNELWIIDHSTTIEESATSSGGNKGKGGDLLYRWGNPEAYRKGAPDSNTLFGAHGTNWVPRYQNDKDAIIFFNNGNDVVNRLYSSVEYLEPERDGYGNYVLNSEGKFSPENAVLIYEDSDEPRNFWSEFLSNAHYLPNGNVFINEGGKGHLFEVDSDQNIVWDYVSPVTNNSIATQGGSTRGNFIFRAYKYPIGYPAFSNRDLTPATLPLEGDNEFFNCISSGNEEVEAPDLSIKYSKVNKAIKVEQEDSESLQISIFSITGQEILRQRFSLNSIEIDLSHLQAGIYVAKTAYKNGAQKSLKFVVQ